jgi:hypothetical protein
VSKENAQYQVGQSLYFAPTMRSHRSARDVTITVVGRKWITLSNNMRFELGKTEIDGEGYASPGAVFPSKEAFELHDSLLRKWRLLQKSVALVFEPPAGVAKEDIVQAMRLLCLDDCERNRQPAPGVLCGEGGAS